MWPFSKCSHFWFLQKHLAILLSSFKVRLKTLFVFICNNQFHFGGFLPLFCTWHIIYDWYDNKAQASTWLYHWMHWKPGVDEHDVVLIAKTMSYYPANNFQDDNLKQRLITSRWFGALNSRATWANSVSCIKSADFILEWPF